MSRTGLSGYVSVVEITELGPRLYLIKPVFGQVYLWHDGSQLTMVDTGALWRYSAGPPCAKRL